MRTVKTDPKRRILGALHCHAWLPIVALHAGMKEQEALEWLMQLEKEGRVRKHKEDVWGMRGGARR